MEKNNLMTLHQQPSSFPPCSACGGRLIGTRCEPRMILMRQGATFQHPITGLRALVCTNCGYTNLYADNLNNLNQEVEKHPEDFEL